MMDTLSGDKCPIGRQTTDAAVKFRVNGVDDLMPAGADAAGYDAPAYGVLQLLQLCGCIGADLIKNRFA